MTEQENKQNNPEMKMTKYDKKMQRRREEEEKAKKKKAVTKVVVGVAAVACVGLIGWNLYDNYQEKNGPYVTVDNHEIKKAEFDYYYYSSLNSFAANYGSYLSYFGLDTSKPLDQQMYTENMTWDDYFQQQAVGQLQNVYALNDEAAANGFEYDAASDYVTFVESIQTAAENQGVSADDYCKSLYGNSATVENLESYICDSVTASAYYDSIKDATEVTDEEITSYYNENKDNYDSVDYRVYKIEAEMPVEETAAPVAEGETAETGETETMTAEESEAAEAAKEEAKKAALAAAKTKADEMLSKITDEASFKSVYTEYSGEAATESLKTNVKKSSVSPSVVADWLFDSARQSGDKAVIEYETGSAYYVVYFVNRYLDHTKTVDVRHILITPETAEENADQTEEAKEAAKAEAKTKAEAIYQEWQAGDATEDSFAKLAEANSADTGSASKGGLYEAVTKGQMVESFDNWIFDAARQTGDTDIVETNYGYHIMYYVGDNAEAWHVSIKDTLLSNKMNEYMTALLENKEVVDNRGDIAYLHQTEAETETAESAAETENK